MSAAEKLEPAPAGRRLVRVDGWAVEARFPTTAAARRWLLRRGFTLYKLDAAGDRVRFVDLAEIEARMVAATPAPKEPEKKPRLSRDEAVAGMLDEATRRR